MLDHSQRVCIKYTQPNKIIQKKVELIVLKWDCEQFRLYFCIVVVDGAFKPHAFLTNYTQQ